MTLHRPLITVSKALAASLILFLAATFDRSSNLTAVVFDGTGWYTEILAANADHTTDRLLKQVVPGADSFSDKEGEVPVYKAYRTDAASGDKTLIGYAVVTSDIKPEPDGYSGPIDTLIGMDLEGTVVGLVVIYHKESLRYVIGDFFEYEEWFSEQFLGMTATNKFALGKNGDIDGIAKATISSNAMARGVRQTVRAVTAAYIQ